MGRKSIQSKVERQLYAESMGRCMNPNCNIELFTGNGDISEKAHIEEYSNTQNNSFENLILLCPNCHTDFDKNGAFTKETVRLWKNERKSLISKVLDVKCTDFDSLKDKIVPLLVANKILYETYFNQESREGWEKIEPKLIANNEYIKLILESNMHLFQTSSYTEYSNLHIVQKFISHIDEFRDTRSDAEKIRYILFSHEINSIFGIAPIDSDDIYFNTETIAALMSLNIITSCKLGIPKPSIVLGNGEEILLSDIPRLRQLCYDHKAFRKKGVNLKSLNWALKYIVNRGKRFEFSDKTLTLIKVNNKRIKFVYEYCFGKEYITSIENINFDVIVNLYNWNGGNSISSDAKELAFEFGIELYTLDEFYGFIRGI